MDRSAAIRLGPYQFHQRLGEGSSGQVWRATGPDGPVAVKILGPAADLDDAARARFGREVGALARLDHPALVRLLDHGFDDELGPYLVLPLLVGATLRELVAGRALCPEAAILLARPIAEAAAALHAAGYVHRDLKPENAIAAADGQVTVIDLGLAWRDGMTRHTESGAAVGSIGYMAPEQIEGRPVGPPADVWAIGVMLYEWIAGKRPFARPRPTEEAAAALVGAFAPLGAVDRRADERLAGLVQRCLAADPAARPAAAALAAELAALIDWPAEAAAVIADPAGFEARIAPWRVARLERAARDALGDGRPFSALALCDRALAYAPDRPELAALVAEVERATAPAPSVPAPPPPRRGRWQLPAAIAAGALLAGALVLVGMRRDEPRRPPPPAVTTLATGDPEAAELARGMLSLFDRAMTADEERRRAGTAPPAPPARRPTTAAGWLALAGEQAPAEALVSVRQALALQPTWTSAKEGLCRVLAELEDPEALTACDEVARAHPADPQWLLVRAAARERAGDRAGAAADRQRACSLGAADGC